MDIRENVKNKTISIRKLYLLQKEYWKSFSIGRKSGIINNGIVNKNHYQLERDRYAINISR